MRIAYTCQNISVKGGLERIIVEKASAMASRGHDVCLIVNNPAGTNPAYDVDPRVRLVDISMNQPTSIGERIAFKIRQNLRIRKALRQFNPDVTVVIPTWLTWAMLCGPGRIVVESHCSKQQMFSNERQSIYKRFKVFIAERRCNALICLTREDKANWKLARRVEVIPNFSGITLPEKYLTGNRSGTMAVGRLSFQKQFDLLIEAWAIVARKHPGQTLDIYGDGELKESLQQQITNSGLGSVIKLRGNTDNIAEAYRTHSFLVMSSRFEGLPLVLIEAISSGCPCISLDCPEGPREIIINEENGLLVPYRGRKREQHVSDLAEAIERLIEEPGLLERLSDAAIQSSHRYDKDTIIDRWENLFKELTE